MAEYIPGISHGKTYEVGDIVIYSRDNTECVITHIVLKQNGMTDRSLVAMIRAKDKDGRNVIATSNWFFAPIKKENEN
jgi:hypothetical protein